MYTQIHWNRSNAVRFAVFVDDGDDGDDNDDDDDDNDG